MAGLVLILTCPLTFIAYFKKTKEEQYYFLKLFGIWLLCQLYITINNSLRFPLGIICAILIVYKTNFNKISKCISLTLGIASLLLTSAIYLLLKN